jgi:hypothetical protein
MLSPARVPVVGGSRRLLWGRANAGGGGGTVGGFAGLVGGAEVVRLGDGLVPIGPLRLRDGLGLEDWLVTVGVGGGLVTVGLGGGVVSVGLGDGQGHVP